MKLKTLAPAEQLWQRAEQAAAGDAEILPRVRLARLPLRYVWLTRWTALRKECQDAGANWPLPDSRLQVAEDWRTVANGQPGQPWTKVTLINESGVTPEKFLARFAEASKDARK